MRLSARIESAAASDPVRVAAVVHRLKSAARPVGALALEQVCAELERAGRADDREGAAQRIEAFAQA